MRLIGSLTRPNRVEGTWKPQKLLRRWDKYFASSEPNAQAGFKADEEQELLTFEMFKPKMKSGKMIFNVKPLTDSGRDKLTGLQDIELSDISLFIDESTPSVPSCFPNCEKADLRRLDMSGLDLYINFDNADLRPKGATPTNLSGAVLYGAQLTGAKLNGANLSCAGVLCTNVLSANLTGANLTNAFLEEANLSGATYDPKTAWPTADYWNDTTCPDGTNSNDPGNATCGL